MKLLSQTQIKDEKRRDLARDVLRVREMEQTIEETKRRLAQSQADFSLKMAEFLDTWATKEEEYQKRMSEMSKEVEELEERRKIALIPLEIERAKAYDLMKEAKEAMNICTQKQERLDETQKILEERLDDVGDRELVISTQERALQSRLEGINAQSEMIQEGSKRLSEQMAEFEQRMKNEETKLENRKKEITLIEINLIAKNNKIKKDVEAIGKAWKTIKDQRATLERAMQRIKK